MKELEIQALTSNLPQVLDFVRERLEEVECGEKERNQIEVAVEDIFTNISSYACNPEVGPATVRVEMVDVPLTVDISFVDHGQQYDPLAKPDPNLKMSLKDRKRGGLGIFMTKKYMDDVWYEYKDGKNILTLKKKILRQPEVDLAKAVVIFFLATIHAYVECSTDDQLWTGLPYFFDSVLGGPWAAPMFIFSMGIGLAFTARNKPRDIIMRGFNIFLVGILLNVFRFLIPSLVGYAITDDRAFYIKPLAYRFFGNDLLQFAALAMILMGILKLLKLTPWKIFFVGLMLSGISFFLRDVWTDYMPLNVFLGHFVGVDDGTEKVMSDFPLIIWFIMYASGYVFGGYLKHMKDKKTFYKWVTLPCLIIPVIVYVIEYREEFGMMGGPGANVFYHFTTPEAFLCIATELGMLGVYFFITQHLSDKARNLIERVSRNVTVVYVIQWVLVWWAANVIIYIIRDSKYLASWQTLILGLTLSTASVLLAELWSGSRRRRIASKKNS